MDTIASMFLLLLIGAYLYFGDKAIYYLKYHVLGVRGEVYSDTINYIGQRAVFAAMFGWAAIPLAILHNVLFAKK